MTTRMRHEAHTAQSATVAAALSAVEVRKSLPLGRERIDILKGIGVPRSARQHVADGRCLNG